MVISIQKSPSLYLEMISKDSITSQSVLEKQSSVVLLLESGAYLEVIFCFQPPLKMNQFRFYKIKNAYKYAQNQLKKFNQPRNYFLAAPLSRSSEYVLIGEINKSVRPNNTI